MNTLKKELSKISFGTVIIAFFLPFLLIKCGNNEIANLSGIQLVMGTEVGSGSDGKKIAANIFAIVSFLGAIGGLAIVFKKIKNWELIGLVISIVGLISLLLLFNDLASKVSEKEYGGVISISFGVGFYLAFIGYLVNSIFLGLKINEKEETVT